MSVLASCGETRTRSSCAETWRRSSSSARVSFSNWASCSFTEAKMLAVDSTSESSMKGRIKSEVDHRGSRKEGVGPPHFTLGRGSKRKREMRKDHRSEKTDALLIPSAKDALCSFTAVQIARHRQPSLRAHHQRLLRQSPWPSLFYTPLSTPIGRNGGSSTKVSTLLAGQGDSGMGLKLDYFSLENFAGFILIKVLTPWYR